MGRATPTGRLSRSLKLHPCNTKMMKPTGIETTVSRHSLLKRSGQGSNSCTYKMVPLLPWVKYMCRARYGAVPLSKSTMLG